MSEQKTYGVYADSEYREDGERTFRSYRLGTAYTSDDQSFRIVLHGLPLTDLQTGTAKLSMRLLKNKDKSSIPQNSYTLFDMQQEAR